MNKKLQGIFLILLLIGSIAYCPSVDAAATVPLSITVNGSLVITAADDDTMSGKDPTRAVTINLTPDIGHTLQSGSANFRIRTNRTNWRFTAQTNLSSISTTAAVDVISGTAKTSSAKDNSNTNNWFQVGTTYSIQPDFFYAPGTFSSTITYNLVSP